MNEALIAAVYSDIADISIFFNVGAPMCTIGAIT